VVLRRAVAGDVGFLREMLYLALFVPPGAEPFHPEILDKPELARIVEGFGAEVGDAGWIAAMDSGKPLGAAWVRRFSVDAPGFGYVDDQTPELSIAVDVTARPGEIISARMSSCSKNERAAPERVRDNDDERLLLDSALRPLLGRHSRNVGHYPSSIASSSTAPSPCQPR